MSKKLYIQALMIFLTLVSIFPPQQQAAAGNITIGILPNPTQSTAFGTPITAGAYLKGFSMLGLSGQMTFKLFPPADITCSGTPKFSESVSVYRPSTSIGGYYFPSNTSDLFYPPDKYIPTEAGIWYWQVSYSGDKNNSSAISACSAAPVSIWPGRYTYPDLNLQLSAGIITQGEAVHASVHLTDVHPDHETMGTVTYKVYGNDSCSGSPTNSMIKTLTGGVTPDSNDITFDTAGVYSWSAFYSGDNNNKPADSYCLKLQVSLPESITPSFSPTNAHIGDQLNARLTRQSSTAPSLTVLFSLYSPSDPTCNFPLYQALYIPWVETRPGIWVSATETSTTWLNDSRSKATVAGTYRWKITDYTSASLVTNCADLPQEVAAKATPTLTLSFPSEYVVVNTNTQVYTSFSGAPTDLGSTNYTRYSDENCTQSPMSIQTFIGSTVPTGVQVSFPALGTYSVKATYSGDTNNLSASSNCVAIEVVAPKLSPSLSLELSPNQVSIYSANPTLRLAYPTTPIGTLTGATANAGGTLAYKIYNDNLCTDFFYLADLVEVKNGVAPASQSIEFFGSPGEAYFKAIYSGDFYNIGAESACQVLTVVKASPSVSLLLSTNSTTSGSPVSARGSISNNAGNTTITFKVYSDNACTQEVASPATVETFENGYLLLGVPSSAPVSLELPGTYYWRIFSAGDQFNEAAASNCTDAALTISPALATRYAASTGLESGACDSWANACKLQYALSVAHYGNSIWVKAGTYKPHASDRTLSFALKDGVALYGGFAGTETQLSQRNPAANPTILSGDIGLAGNNTDNSYHVVVASGVSDKASLDGFTITAGNGDTNYGAGIYNDNASPNLENLTISGNTANAGGGMYNINSSPSLKNVTFEGNSAPGEGGGGIYNNTSNPSFTNVTFSGNSAGGYGGGGLLNLSSNPTLTNVTFSGNSATSGGGMVNYSSSPTLKNTLIANSSGGGDCVGALNALSFNNLVEDPSNSCGLSDGTAGNITGVDPKLGALANNGGYTRTFALLPGSKAIDTGANTGCPTSDQRGIPRPLNGNNDTTVVCDIGAFEYKDVTAPNTSLSSMPPLVTGSTSASFTFGGTDVGTGVIKYECKLDAGAFAACASPKAYSGLAATSHTFAVRAFDRAGNADATPATYTWKITAERLVNGGFNLYTGTSRIPTGWTATNFAAIDGKDTTVTNKKEGTASLKITGLAGKVKSLTQTINLTGLATDSLTFSFMSKGVSIPTTGLCQAQVFIYNGITLRAVKTIPCKTGSFGYAQSKLTFTSGVAYTRLVVKFIYSKASGTVWFDQASLVK